MKAYINSKGDPSVGLNGFDTEVDLQIDFDDSGDQREVTRKHLSDCFAHVWDDGKVRVVFEDELRDEDMYNDGQPDEAQEWHDYDPDC